MATLAGVATASKTAQVAPKAVQRAITTLMQQKGATAPDAAYVPVEEAERFFQAGGVADADIPAAIQQTLGDAAAASYHEAAEGLNGGKIRIPMADYLSKAGPTGFADAMVQDTALSPTDKTVRQARKERAEIDAGAKKLADEYEKTDVPHASEAESIMVGAVESWLDSQKMLDEDGRRRVVSLWRAMARTTAERFGLPEDVLFDTFTVEAMTKAGDAANPAKVMPQAAASRNIITSWREKTPEERVRAFYEDRITGTLNPRGLDALIKEKKPPLMVVWDIAGGKAINDDRKTGGHEVLDQVFRGVAQTVHAAAPGRTGKQGGSIVALVGSQAEADQLVKDVMAAHPEKRVKLRAWVGPVAGTAKQTVKAIGEASKKA
ncbi:MAG TPA: hypothetical protein VLT61_07230, partial [Anaeromyxobacteraceae bacterium]|nr:hypothetical protein [Anaeromyxobacteraceae bacterium]